MLGFLYVYDFWLRQIVRSFIGNINKDDKVLSTMRHPVCYLSPYWQYKWAIIRCLHNLKIFFAGIPQGPLETSPGTIEKIQKRFQGPPARGF